VFRPAFKKGWIMMITVPKRFVESLRCHEFMSRGAFLIEPVSKIQKKGEL